MHLAPPPSDALTPHTVIAMASRRMSPIHTLYASAHGARCVGVRRCHADYRPHLYYNRCNAPARKPAPTQYTCTRRRGRAGASDSHWWASSSSRRGPTDGQHVRTTGCRSWLIVPLLLLLLLLLPLLRSGVAATAGAVALLGGAGSGAAAAMVAAEATQAPHRAFVRTTTWLGSRCCDDTRFRLSPATRRCPGTCHHLPPKLPSGRICPVPRVLLVPLPLQLPPPQSAHTISLFLLLSRTSFLRPSPPPMVGAGANSKLLNANANHYGGTETRRYGSCMSAFAAGAVITRACGVRLYLESWHRVTWWTCRIFASRILLLINHLNVRSATPPQLPPRHSVQ